MSGEAVYGGEFMSLFHLEHFFVLAPWLGQLFIARSVNATALSSSLGLSIAMAAWIRLFKTRGK